MPNIFTTPGGTITQRITFNSGVIDFGSNRLVQLDNVSVGVSWTIAPLYTINSIKPQDIVRHTQKVEMTGKIKSFAPELYMLAFGSSTIGTPQEVDTLDGQATLQNPVLTLFDRNNKQYQYQVQNALVRSIKLGAKMEDYAEWDFELEAKDIVLVYTA